MGDWQEASQLQPPLPDAGETVPFHQAICFSLKVCRFHCPPQRGRANMEIKSLQCGCLERG